MAELHERILKAILTLLLGYADSQHASRCDFETLGEVHTINPSENPLLPVNRLVARKFEDLRIKIAHLLWTDSFPWCEEGPTENESEQFKQQCLKYLIKVSFLLVGREPDFEDEECSIFLRHKPGSKRISSAEFIPWETTAVWCEVSAFRIRIF